LNNYEPSPTSARPSNQHPNSHNHQSLLNADNIIDDPLAFGGPGQAAFV
jgi:hypothetical protein